MADLRSSVARRVALLGVVAAAAVLLAGAMALWDGEVGDGLAGPLAEITRELGLVRERLAAAEAREAAVAARREREAAGGQARQRLTDEFGVMIQRVIGTLEGSVDRVEGATDGLLAAAEQTSERSAAVSAAALQSAWPVGWKPTWPACGRRKGMRCGRG